MGVPGLWSHLANAKSSSTLLQLTEQAWASPARGFRVGIDVSLWLFHTKKMATLGEDIGPNADLRTLFYRLAQLLCRGILPLFVLDGPSRPAWKRNHYIGGGGNRVTPLERQFIVLIELMGMKWRKAKGEAEAELADLARRGIIDAVMTDDVDTLLFGAPLVIRNNSVTLSGNKTQPPIKDSKAVDPKRTPCKNDVVLYRASDVLTHCGLTPEGLVLVALLSGGDYYPSGITGVGDKFAVGLAKAGFAKALCEAVSSEHPQSALAAWREAVAVELDSNASGYLPSKRPSSARTIRQAVDFPQLSVVDAYINPQVSANVTSLAWDQEIDLAGLTDFVSAKFEWPVHEIAAHFRSILWKGLLVSELRRGLLVADNSIPRSVSLHSAQAKTKGSFGTAGDMLIAIHDLKLADSTDGVLSYRIEVAGDFFYSQLVQYLPDPDPFAHVEAPAIPEPSSDSEDAPPTSSAPTSTAPSRAKCGTKDLVGRTAHSHWLPVAFFRGGEGCAGLVEKYEDRLTEKQRKKEAKSPTKSRSKVGKPAASTAKLITSTSKAARTANLDDIPRSKTFLAASPAAMKPAPRRLPAVSPLSSPDLPPTRISKASKGKEKVPVMNDEYDDDDLLRTRPASRPGAKKAQRAPPMASVSSSDDDLPRNLEFLSSLQPSSRSSSAAPIKKSSVTKKKTQIIEIPSSSPIIEPTIIPRRESPPAPHSPSKRRREGSSKDRVQEGLKRMEKLRREEQEEAERWADVPVLELSD